MVCALSPCRQREVETAKLLQEETAGQAEALRSELQKATQQLEDASKHVRGSPVPSVWGARGMQKGRVQRAAALGEGNRVFRMVCLPAKVEPAEEVKFEGVVTTVC